RFDRRIRLHQNRPIGAHGKRRAQLLLGVGDTDADRDDLDVAAALLDAQGLLERDFIERIHAHFHAVEHHAAAVGLDADAHVVVDDALDAYHDLLHLMYFLRRFTVWALRANFLRGRGDPDRKLLFRE